jgi:hypothetical protein
MLPPEVSRSQLASPAEILRALKSLAKQSMSARKF